MIDESIPPPTPRGENEIQRDTNTTDTPTMRPNPQPHNGPVTIRLVRSPWINIGVCRRCRRSFVRPPRPNFVTRHTCGRCMRVRFDAIMERAAR